MRLLWSLLVLAGLLIASVIFIAQPPPRGELAAAYTSIGTLDPTRMQASYDIRFGYAMFEGLATFDPYTMAVQPGVAESWQVSDDRLQWVFELRDDARWSDGTPVTAADFAETWRQSMLPDFAGPYHSFLMHIRGAQAYFDWAVASHQAVMALADPAAQRPAAQQRVEQIPGRFAQMVGVRVVDARTLVVELETALPYFEELAACWPLFPLHRSVRESAKLNRATWMLRRGSQWLHDQPVVSNGPYVLDQWLFKRYIHLRANRHYWNADPAMPQTILALQYSDGLAAYNAYMRGQVDVIFGVVVDFLPDLVEAAAAGKRHDIHAVNNWGTYYYGFNCRPALSDGRANPLRDARVRRALAMTVDKAAIVNEVTRLRQTVARSFIPPDSIVGYASPDGVDCLSDARNTEQRQAMIARARALLAEAGYPAGRGIGVVDLVFNTGGGHEKTAEAIAAMWESALGVNVRLRGEEWGVFMNSRHQGRFMVARQGWFGDYGDPTTFLDLFATDNGNNDTGFSDQQYDQLLHAAANTPDRARRMDLLQQAERYIVRQQLPIVPLYHYRLVHAYDPQRLDGVSHHPRNLQMFHLMRVND
jgi:oligopeptide transport system substrate-binding protein